MEKKIKRKQAFSYCLLEKLTELTIFARICHNKCTLGIFFRESTLFYVASDKFPGFLLENVGAFHRFTDLYHCLCNGILDERVDLRHSLIIRN